MAVCPSVTLSAPPFSLGHFLLTRSPLFLSAFSTFCPFPLGGVKNVDKNHAPTLAPFLAIFSFSLSSLSSKISAVVSALQTISAVVAGRGVLQRNYKLDEHRNDREAEFLSGGMEDQIL